MNMTIEDFREARRYRVELVLIGMALGSTAAATAITKDVPKENITGVRNQECLVAIRNKDREAVMRWIESLGIETDKKISAVANIVAHVNELSETTKLRSVISRLREAEFAGSASQMKSQISQILKELEK